MYAALPAPLCEVFTDRDVVVGVFVLREPPEVVPRDWPGFGALNVRPLRKPLAKLLDDERAIRGIRVRSHELHEVVDVARVSRCH